MAVKKQSQEDTGNPTVTLTKDQWAQMLGMLEQGTQVLLSQLSMQQGGLQQVAQLSAVASGLIEEIKKQLPQ